MKNASPGTTNFITRITPARANRNAKEDFRLVDVFNYAVKYFGLPKNPCIENIGRQKRNSENIDFWTLDEYQEFISHVSAIEYRIIFELLFYTGMRIGELRALTLSDLDFYKKNP